MSTRRTSRPRQRPIKETYPSEDRCRGADPTRVKLTVEVPFDELKPNLDKAYKEISQQVRIFRPGKVPAPLIDKYVGRGAVLQEAVNDALPELYGRAVEETEIFVLGQPDVEVTELEDGTQFAFTAEVDIRPKFEVPDYDGLEVVVEDAEVTDEQVEETIGNLRERFASSPTPSGPSRRATSPPSTWPRRSTAKRSRTPPPCLLLRGRQQVGHRGPGRRTHRPRRGRGHDVHRHPARRRARREEAEITVTVQSVKVKNLPDLDDEFAQLASEFDTIDELREDVRTRLGTGEVAAAVRGPRQGLEALLEKVDIPLPDKVVEEEVGRRNQQLEQQLQMAGMSKEDYLRRRRSPPRVRHRGRRRGPARGQGRVRPRPARRPGGAGRRERGLSEYVVTQAMQMGVQPQQLAEYLTQNNQLPAIVSRGVRSKALNLVVEHVTVKDESGNEIDVEAVQRELNGETGETVQADEAEESEEAPAETAEAAAAESPAAEAKDEQDAKDKDA